MPGHSRLVPWWNPLCFSCKRKQNSSEPLFRNKTTTSHHPYQLWWPKARQLCGRRIYFYQWGAWLRVKGVYLFSNKLKVSAQGRPRPGVTSSKQISCISGFVIGWCRKAGVYSRSMLTSSLCVWKAVQTGFFLFRHSVVAVVCLTYYSMCEATQLKWTDSEFCSLFPDLFLVFF